MKKFLLAFVILLFAALPALTQAFSSSRDTSTKIIPAADRLDNYLPLLKGKSVGIFANHTSVVGTSHLVDTLLKNDVKIAAIFAPEHGFRGTADAGQKLDNSIDAATGIPVISLYGKKRKPSAEDLKNIDVLLFDIQDVGVRFYTYISSLEEFMEAAISSDKPLIILDRPNPNGHYIDGPVLQKKFKSFVGMQPVPVVYGMTIGEYAGMLLGERWIDSSLHGRINENKVRITVIPCQNYSHSSMYSLPVKPSPNLPNMQSIYLYPSTCFFEGTILSEGRGTDKPFQLFGHPRLPRTLTSFTPRSREGATNPKLKDQQCFGWDLSGTTDEVLKTVNGKLQIKYLLEAYRQFPAKDSFFLKNGFFNLLAGNDELMKQVKSGLSEKLIRKSWEKDIERFKLIRKKYLLYPDFSTSHTP